MWPFNDVAFMSREGGAIYLTRWLVLKKVSVVVGIWNEDPRKGTEQEFPCSLPTTMRRIRKVNDMLFPMMHICAQGEFYVV